MISDEPIHPWHIVCNGYTPERQLLNETLLAQANGYIGSRGTFEEALNDRFPTCEGIYLNGVFQEEPIAYGESAYGFATHNQKMIQVPNGKRIDMALEGESLRIGSNALQGFQALDFRTGVLSREQIFQTAQDKVLKLHSRRFVSLATHQLMCIEYQVTAENFSGAVKLSSALDAGYSFQIDKEDPRVGHLSIKEGLSFIKKELTDSSCSFIHSVNGSDFIVASHSFDVLPEEAHLSTSESNDDWLGHSYEISLEKGKPITFYKWIGYAHTNASKNESELLLQELQALVQQTAKQGFNQELERHVLHLSQFWQQSDVIIEGDDSLQQGIRFNMFHTFQSSGRNGLSNIGAKGLTGHGYDGHYFWDTEIYAIPFFCYTQPELARKLIEFRINTLPQARMRAQVMSHKTGALFPWRTIGGNECSAYFPAGTAQYHINADIAYALKCYIQATNDWSLLWQGGAELLFETARLWIQLGHFNPRRNQQFCIDGVTGPDEYTAVVNNNFYTNSMARMHLTFAVEMAQVLQDQDEDAFGQLADSLQLDAEEVDEWCKAAALMYIPYDEKLRIHKQDDTFLDKAVWDFANTPPEQYPLLLNFHPLVIYRHQVLKQADVMMAMYLLDDEFDLKQKSRNMAYYEPLTTHDSSLSSCIHSIVCAEIGQYEKAYGFFKDTVRMDLDNNHNNSEFGVHIACMAGSWSSIVHGFSGLRVRKSGLHFKPILPDGWTCYQFRINYQSSCVLVNINCEGISYQLLKGEELIIYHFEEMVRLSGEQLIRKQHQGAQYTLDKQDA